MSVQTDIRADLKRLQIPRDQRPVAATRTRGHAGRWIAFFLLLGLAAGGYFGRATIKRLIGMAVASTAPQSEVRLITVAARREEGPPPVLTATGKIVSDHRVAVATKVSGQIVSLHFEQGDVVEPGQIIARIEDVNYRALRDQARAMLEKSKANLEYQRVNFERMSSLHRGDDASTIEFHDAKRWYEEAEAQVNANQAALDFAQKALDDCEVRVPIAGVILERNVEVGDFVAAEGGRGANANAQFATIADMDKLRVEVDVSELDITRIRKDMTCTVIPDAYKDRRYKGYVMWLDPAANYSKATVQVKVRIEQPDQFLRISGSAQVAFLPDVPPADDDSPAAARIWIPRSACTLSADGKSARVFVAGDGKLVARNVTIGLTSGAQVEITSGLADGQSIAADGLDQLTDGMPLKP